MRDVSRRYRPNRNPAARVIVNRVMPVGDGKAVRELANIGYANQQRDTFSQAFTATSEAHKHGPRYFADANGNSSVDELPDRVHPREKRPTLRGRSALDPLIRSGCRAR